jgi:hypothetical protein
MVVVGMIHLVPPVVGMENAIYFATIAMVVAEWGFKTP